jgi:acyl-CoA synthetase (AMP-forming)/AMP-acid ligase II
VRLDVAAEALAGGQVQAVPPESAGSTTLVSSGVLDGVSRVAIADPATLRPLGDGQVGEIWVSGGSVALGYWRRPADTAAAFHARLADTGAGPFLRTGDLGFVRGGRLFVTGRIKDVLIVRGLKYYPQDLELTAERAHPAVRAGGCAAFGIPRRDGEGIGILAEIDPRSIGLDAGARTSTILDALRAAIVTSHHIVPAAVALVPAGSLPKTTSGKLQRYLCARAFAAGGLEPIDAWIDDRPQPELAAS